HAALTSFPTRRSSDLARFGLRSIGLRSILRAGRRCIRRGGFGLVFRTEVGLQFAQRLVGIVSLVFEYPQLIAHRLVAAFGIAEGDRKSTRLNSSHRTI